MDEIIEEIPDLTPMGFFEQGRWAGGDAQHVRNIKWTCDNMRSFVDKARGKPIDAVIEHVRDGSTVRCLLLPDFNYITLMISGIRVSFLNELC